jgi:hypothetical protein
MHESVNVVFEALCFPVFPFLSQFEDGLCEWQREQLCRSLMSSDPTPSARYVANCFLNHVKALVSGSPHLSSSSSSRFSMYSAMCPP